MENNDVEDEIIIHGNIYKVVNTEISQALLKFYPENPRVYAILDVKSGTPDQSAIEKAMTKMEHVKQLKESIKANGGLIDSVLVRDGDYIVLEGNSRLAAYRLLAKEDPIKWGKMKCKLLPKDISDSAIFQLLGQYHIIGRKDWSPYEQAGYLYRRVKVSNQSIDSISSELGITKNSAQYSIDVYEYMINNNDTNPEKWSFYDELLKNKNIKEALDNVDGLQETINKDIKENKIVRALDIREKLGGIAKVKDKDSRKILRKVADGDADIYDGYQILNDEGKTGNIYYQIKKFRIKITENDFETRMLNEQNDSNIRFELKKIKKTTEQLLKKLER